MVMTDRFNLWWFDLSSKPKLGDFSYKKLNRNLKDAYEDSMKLAVLYLIVIYLILRWLEWSANNKASISFKDELIGGVGVIGVTSFIRYFILIIARIIRFLRREFWYVKKPSL